MSRKKKKKIVSVGEARLRGHLIQIQGDLSRFSDIAYLEMPEFLIERDQKGPFLRVVTEKGHYRIRLEKEYRMKRQSDD